jgi:hypothetical protein
MSGVKVYYELAMPEVIDITDKMPIDNYIKVEGGGSIATVNNSGTDVPAPITMIYQRRS